VPQAVGVTPLNSTSLGSWYFWPLARKASFQVSSVEARTLETKRAVSSSAGGRWAAGALCSIAGMPPPPLSMLSTVSGLMPRK
jgi:hypothetical protein